MSSFANPDLDLLIAAVQRGDGPAIQWQLQRIHPDTPGEDGTTPLLEAIRCEQLESVDALLDGGADPNRPDFRGETPPLAAAFRGGPDMLRTVLARGGDANAQNPYTGATVLMQALRSGHQSQHVVVLEAGADPNRATRGGDTALHVAARLNAGAAILDLLEAGAMPLLRNSRGFSFQSYYFPLPGYLANERVRDERRRVIQWLKSHGIPLEAAVED